MGTAIKHPVPDRIKPSFVVLDIRTLWPSYKTTGINWIHSMYGANDASCTSDGTTSYLTMKSCIVPACSTSTYIVRKRSLGLFGHAARLRRDVPANQILQICTKSRVGERPSQEWRRAMADRRPLGPTRSAATRV